MSNEFEFLTWDVDEIWKNLWQGSLPPAGNAVGDKGFTTLVLAASEHQDFTLYPNVSRVLLAPGEDCEDQWALNKTLPVWLDAAQAAATRVKTGEKVLVTCLAGLNRSGFITAVALHHITGWSGEACVKRVQERRRLALCNETFVRYICDSFKATSTT